MSKHSPIRIFSIALVIMFSLVSCDRLDMLTQDSSAEKWLSTHPHVAVEIGSVSFTFAEPSSTVIVYALGALLAFAGIWTLARRRGSVSKTLWGIGLLAWSLSTFLAGTSYQAFSYEFKFAGRDPALFTTWWEIWYLVFFVASVGFVTAGTAFSSLAGKARKALMTFASVNFALYFCIVMAGAFIPDAFLASFELMVLFAFPTFAILLFVNARTLHREKKPLEKRLVISWISMFAVVIVYFGYFTSGLSGILWDRGIWFNANDVLHIGLCGWVAWYLIGVEPILSDLEPSK